MSASMKEVAEQTESILNAVAKAHRAWALQSQTDSGFLERVATYCAFKIMFNTFDLPPDAIDESDRHYIEEFIKSVQLPLVPLAEVAAATTKILA